MKYFKTFEATKDSWSPSGSVTFNLLKKLWDAIPFSSKSRKIKKIASEYDQYLQTVYDHYLTERKTIPNVKPNIEVEDQNDDNQEDSIEVPLNEPLSTDTTKIEEPVIESKKLTQVLDITKYSVLEYEPEIKLAIENANLTNSDIDKIVKMIEKKIIDKLREKELIFTQKKNVANINQYMGFLADLKDDLTKLKANEAVDWSANAVKAPENWTEEDRRILTSKVNPYKIEEFSLRKRAYVDDELDPKKAKKLEQEWLLLVNTIHKKWFYIFDITNLDNKYKTAVKKESPTAVRSYNTLEKLKASFPNIKLVQRTSDFSSGYGHYIISGLNNDLILLFKLSNVKLFKVVGTLFMDGNKSKIDYSNPEDSKFVWKVNEKYKNFIKDTYLETEVDGKKMRIRMTTALGTDYPCIKIVDDSGYLMLSSFYEDNGVKVEEMSLRNTKATIYNLNETLNLNVKNPSPSISEELKKMI